MKFFVPCARDPTEADLVWLEVRFWLSEMGLPTTGRRIAALVCAVDGVDHFLAVGRETPEGDLAAVILEASDTDLFYVCTAGRGVLEGMPYAMWLDERWRVIDFDEEVVGHA